MDDVLNHRKSGFFSRLSGREGLVWQLLLVLLAWLFLCSLHWDNDGLWFQGDAPRHAANGMFWKDYLSARPTNSLEYALSYFARYPVIRPTGYPPLFYLLEAVPYAVLGPSPYFPKALVLCFALLAALYTTAWVRHWFDPRAGWAGALFLLLPGTVRWSHAIMLNVPALAFTLGALFHASRWLEGDSPPSKRTDMYAMVGLGLAGILTYYQAGIVVPVTLLWVAGAGRWRWMWDRKLLALAGGSALILLPCALLLVQWEARVVHWFTPNHLLLTAGNWLYYPRHLTELAPPPILILAFAGTVIGWKNPDWRRVTVMLLVWCAVTYVVFSYLDTKEPRYILPLALPLICFSTMSAVTVGRWLARRTKRLSRCAAIPPFLAVALLIGYQAYDAARLAVPAASGFRQVASSLQQVAPDSFVLYDGLFNGIFSYYTLVGDTGFRRGVFVTGKSFALAKLAEESDRDGQAALGSAVNETIRNEIGARWVAIEELAPPATPVSQMLRQAVTGPAVELVRSFPIAYGHKTGFVRLYRLSGPSKTKDLLDIYFPDLGEEGFFRVRPLGRR